MINGRKVVILSGVSGSGKSTGGGIAKHGDCPAIDASLETLLRDAEVLRRRMGVPAFRVGISVEDMSVEDEWSFSFSTSVDHWERCRASSLIESVQKWIDYAQECLARAEDSR